MEKWESFMEHYGFRCPRELDIATPRYYEKPEEVYIILKNMGTYTDPALTPHGIFENGIKKREETVKFFLNLLQKKGRRKIKAFQPPNSNRCGYIRLPANSKYNPIYH